jgi:hypothetical protein
MIYLLILLVAALAYQVLALLSLGRFFQKPLPSPDFSESPGITVLKPVKGLDRETRACLASFLIQDYQPYQVLFGVADATDPVLPLLEELRREAPIGRLEVILCPQTLGHNPKVSILRQLEPRARYDLLVVADGDVKVGPGFLGRMAAALQEPGVGLVSCPYRAGRSNSLGSWLEALTISADFIPSVAVAHYVEGIRFALGAAMAFTRKARSGNGQPPLELPGLSGPSTALGPDLPGLPPPGLLRLRHYPCHGLQPGPGPGQWTGALGPGTGRRHPGPAPWPGLVLRGCLPAGILNPAGPSPAAIEGSSGLFSLALKLFGQQGGLDGPALPPHPARPPGAYTGVMVS